MLLQILLGCVGLVLLYYGAEFLIGGGVSVAKKFNVPTLIIGLTLMAFGTSAPELVVSVGASVSGHGDISLGNVIGSNICNLALILGLSALVAPLPVNRQLFKLDYWVMLGASAVLAGFCWFSGRVDRWEAAILLLGLIAYVWRQFANAKKTGETEVGGEELPKKIYPFWGALLLIVGGLIGLAGGAELLVRSAVAVAKAMHVSEAVIGLTVVAVGTSLPELATSVVAAMKHEHDIAIGNVIGSNIFNILCIMGIAPLIRPIVGQDIRGFDLIVMLGISVLLLPFMVTGMKISRFEGAILFLIYIGYTVARFYLPA